MGGLFASGKREMRSAECERKEEEGAPAGSPPSSRAPRSQAISPLSAPATLAKRTRAREKVQNQISGCMIDGKLTLFQPYFSHVTKYSSSKQVDIYRG